jgi:ABC-2 type transport system permease protein
MNAVLAIALKDIRLLIRDRMGFFFAFAFPIMTAIFFGSIFGGGGGGGGDDSDSGKIEILLVDEDQTDGSRAFAKTLSGASELKVASVATREEAAAAVRTGKKPAFVALPKGFGATRESMFWGGGTSVVLGVDPARHAESGMLEGLLTKYGFMQLQEGFTNPDVMRRQVRTSLDKLRSSSSFDSSQKQVFEKFFGDLDQFLVDVPRQSDSKPDPSLPPADSSTKPDAASSSGGGGFQPIRIEKADIVKQKEPADYSTPTMPPNNYAWTFPQGMIWGFLGCSMSFAVAMVLERSRGTLLRLRVAPLSAMQVLFGKALACFIMTQVVVILLMLIACFVFGVRPTSYLTLAVAMICTGICFVGLMMMLSVVSKSERAAAGLGWGVMLIFSMIGGGMIPLFILKGWMQTLSVFSPIRWSILALEGGIWRDMSPLEMLPSCAILTGIGVVGFIVGAVLFGKADRS